MQTTNKIASDPADTPVAADNQGVDRTSKPDPIVNESSTSTVGLANKAQTENQLIIEEIKEDTPLT